MPEDEHKKAAETHTHTHTHTHTYTERERQTDTEFGLESQHMQCVANRLLKQAD